MESDQLSQIEKSKKAENLINEILPHLPDYGVFHFAYYAKEVLLYIPAHADPLFLFMLTHHSCGC